VNKNEKCPLMDAQKFKLSFEKAATYGLLSLLVTL
jgi:hypothetical protein